MSDLLTVAEAAEKLRRSPRFVLDELRRKNLRGFKYGGAWSISEAAVRDYLRAHQSITPVGGKS